MAICEQCGKEHDGTFGSGRFCCRSCSNKWVSLHQSAEAKARKVEKGKDNLVHSSTGKSVGFCSPDYWNESNRKKQSEIMSSLNKERVLERLERVFEGLETLQSNRLKWYLISYGFKERKCESCGGTSWLGKDIPLELHHEDGDPSNNSLDNLKILCPNCHAFTDNYRWKKKFK